MADTPSNSESTDAVRKIDLKILSPSAELSAGLELPDTPLSSTIAQLKSRIQAAIPSPPPIERVRIICHGRVSRDAETIEEVLARAPLQDESPRVLHVVISSPHTIHAPHIDQPRASSMPPDARARAVRQSSPFRPARNTPAYGQPAAMRQAQSQHPSRPTTPGPHAPQPVNMNPAEIMNNLLNQAFHVQMTPGFPGMPMAPQRLPSNHPPGFPQLPPELLNPQDIQRAQQELRQQVLQDMNGRTNQPAQENPPLNQLPRTAPVTRSTSPQPSSLGGQGMGATEPQSSTANPPLNPMPHLGPHQHLPNPFQFPGNPLTQAFGTGQLPEGARWTMTVQQNAIVGAPVHGHNHPAGVAVIGQPQPGAGQFRYLGQPGGVDQLGFLGQPFPPGQVGLPQAAVPFGVLAGQPLGLPPGAFPPGLIPRAVSPVTTPSGGHQSPVNGDERNRRIAEAVVMLSTHLTSITRSIHLLGANLGNRRRVFENPREPGLYLHSIADIENLFRAFDHQTAQTVAAFPEITSNAQFGQTQEARRSATVTLAQLYDVVRNQLMPSTLRSTIPPSYGQAQPMQQPQEAAATSQVALPSEISRPQLYILNDQRGNPCALLVGPSGNYVTSPLPWSVLQSLLHTPLQNAQLAQTVRQLTRNVYSQTANDFRYRRSRHRGIGQNTPTGSSSRRPQNVQPQAGAQHVPQPAQAAEGRPAAAHGVQPRQPDEMRDLLAPIIRNLWLMIRIGGFLYFLFGGGRALWRPVALACLAALVYALQAGLFGDHFEPFRRYLDRIVGVQQQPQDGPGQQGGAQQQNQQAQNAGEQNAAPPAEGAQGNPPQPGLGAHVQLPTPEDIARRLVDQRHDENASWMERQLRYIERTVALFIASLWPGIGERAVRRQEENEERIQRLRAEAARRAMELAAASQNTEEPVTSEQAESVVIPNEGSESDKPDAIPTAVASGADVGVAESSSATRVNKGKSRETEEPPEAGPSGS